MPKIDLNAVPKVFDSTYPEPWGSAMGERWFQDIGDAAGLTQYGVVLANLQPGAASSLLASISAIGTVARRARADGFEVAIVSIDKDFFQMVGPGVRVYDPREDGAWFDDDGVVQKFGVRPAQVTDVLRVPVVRLDDLVDGDAAVVKIDVEGAELDVLEGMPRLLGTRDVALIVEWHPLLQQLAGYAPDALPRWLLARSFRLEAASHTSVRALPDASIPRLTRRLLRLQRPVELVAFKPAN